MNPANSHNSAPHIVAGIVSAARMMAERFCEAFGSPSKLLERGDLYGELRTRCLRWLADMEACVRRMLLLRACLFDAPLTTFATKGAATCASEGEPHPSRHTPPWSGEGDPQTLYGPSTDSSQWRVCFALPVPTEAGWVGASPYADARRRKPVRGAKPAPAYYWADDPRPLAERYEALLRVLSDPDHYAERLAARLHYWRGRAESKAALLRSMYQTEHIADEAKLGDEAWVSFADARGVIEALMPVFMHPTTTARWRPSG